jgi:hypothetical protein
VRRGAWLGLLVVVTGGVTGVVLRGRAGAEGGPRTEPLHYAGELLENGVPVDDTRAVTLTLWSSATASDAGSKKCETSAPSTPIVKGAFRVPLDATCLAAVRATSDLWIEAAVGGKSLGRRKLGAAPFALEADHAVSATRAGEASGALEARLAALEQKVAAASNGLGALVDSGKVGAGMGTTGWTLLEGTGDRSIRLPVKFSHPFARPPLVVAGLSQLDIISGPNARLEVSVEEITTAGFTLILHTWADGRIFAAEASWTALLP